MSGVRSEGDRALAYPLTADDFAQFAGLLQAVSGRCERLATSGQGLSTEQVAHEFAETRRHLDQALVVLDHTLERGGAGS